MQFVTMDDMIQARKFREKKMDEIIQNFQTPVILMTINIPGKLKNSDDIYNIFLNGRYEIEKKFLYEHSKVLARYERNVFTGNEFYCVVEEDPVVLKRWMLEIEESEAGRLLNIDVFNEHQDKITRVMLGIPERKCILCGKRVSYCIKMQNHTEAEIRARVLQMIEDTLYGTKEKKGEDHEFCEADQSADYDVSDYGCRCIP